MDLEVVEFMTKTSTVIYHTAKRDVEEDDSIYDLNLLA